MTDKYDIKKPDTLSAEVKYNRYHREVLPDVWIDVYDVIAAFGVTDGRYQHALKKILALGQRGHKTAIQDRIDVLNSILRSDEIHKRRNQ